MSYENHPVRYLMHRRTGRLRLQDIYRVHLGKRHGQDIWIVDGAKVCREIYPPFIMGGNDQRYRFNPLNEVWIDNRMSIEELGYTLAHELIERKLMRERGWTYDRAHQEGGLVTERELRAKEHARVMEKERNQPPMQMGSWSDPTPDQESIKVFHPIRGVYRAFYGKRNGVSIWIVDGPAVRSHYEPDFTYGAHGLEYRFIPRDEIWIDNAISVEEAIFTIKHELLLRKLMAGGMDYDEAYELALAKQYFERDRHTRLARRHEAALAPVRYGVRDKGVKPK
jgi:hypothetical protein